MKEVEFCGQFSTKAVIFIVLVLIMLTLSTALGTFLVVSSQNCISSYVSFNLEGTTFEQSILSAHC